MVTSCPECNTDLVMRRIDDLAVVEFEAYCPSCGWNGTLRYLRCGDCHKNRLFTWTGESWRCIHCGRIRGRASPPKEVKRLL